MQLHWYNNQFEKYLCTPEKKLRRKLQRLLDLDIIEKVNWPNKLVKNPIVPIPKTDQTI